MRPDDDVSGGPTLQTPKAWLWTVGILLTLQSCPATADCPAGLPGKAFHRDIKSANILLGRDGTAKVADFGFACRSTGLACKCKLASGTRGYACPHYIDTLIVSERSEVYSFGMVLLELLTALPPYVIFESSAGETTEIYLAQQINGSIKNALSMIDGSASWPASVAERFAAFALLCIQDEEASRPTFKEIVKELRSLCNESQDVSDCQPPPSPRDNFRAMRAGTKVEEALEHLPAARQQLQGEAPSAGKPRLQAALSETVLPGADRQVEAKLLMWKLECVDVKPVAFHLSGMPAAERILVRDKENKNLKVAMHIGQTPSDSAQLINSLPGHLRMAKKI